MKLQIKVLNSKLGVEWKMPTYAHNGDVGMDLVAALDEPTAISPGSRKLIPAGFSSVCP